MTTEPTPRIKVDLGGLRQRRWYGFCVACRRDLFRRPGRHYASKGHASGSPPPSVAKIAGKVRHNVATRKWRSTRRAHYGPRLVDLRTAPTRIARSIEPIDVDEAIRESSSFQAIEDRAVAVDELIRDHDERHNGLGCGCLDAVLDSE